MEENNHQLLAMILVLVILSKFAYNKTRFIWEGGLSSLEIFKRILFSRTSLFLFGLIFIALGVYAIIRFKIESYRKKRQEEIQKSYRTKKTYLEKREWDFKFENEEPEEESDLEEESSFESMPIRARGRSVTIRVDENKRYFHKKNISKDEVEYLLHKGYQIKKYKNLLNGKMEKFLLHPRFNESFTHLFLTYNVSEYLEKNGIETELYVTKKPDIVFRIKKKRYAIEIETGSIFSKIERMKEKLEVLKNYDEWFFVVTDRNKVKKYKRYGDAVDKRYVKQRLDKLIKLAKKGQK